MRITRREAIVGLLAMPSAVDALAARTDPSPAMGPTVFHWDDSRFVKNDHGSVCSLCKSPTATVDQLEMHITRLNPSQSPHPPHRHVNEELIILREGQVETLSDGEWVKAGPGDVIFNACNSLHGLRNIGSSQAVYHVINWSPNKDAVPKTAS